MSTLVDIEHRKEFELYTISTHCKANEITKKRGVYENTVCSFEIFRIG